MIAVVIPYYQRTPGILAKALTSIAAQQDCPLPVHVIVVDDASPAPAGPEIDKAGPMPRPVQLIMQPNGGPGAARNTGLDHVPAGTRYVAFLDSDDEWTPDHLARAVAALDSGYDFYFADLYHIGQDTSAFKRAGRIQIDQHPELPNLPTGLHAYQGDMFDQIIRGNLIGTPTVVYSFARFAAQRFKIDFTNAGEDYLFWMEIARAHAKIAFSSQAEVRCGTGVNVYSGSGWGSEAYLLRVHNELKYRKITSKLYPLTAAENLHIQTCAKELRVAFIRDLIHRIRQQKKLPITLMAAQLKMDPMTYAYAPFILMRLLFDRFGKDRLIHP